jgi:glycosyltransferase involved in cell wall biosynthesis
VLAILTTHPIQYQAPLWQALARDGRVPFEVWYMTDQGLRPSLDREFNKTFAWDRDTLSGYPHRFLEMAPGATPSSFLKSRLHESLKDRLRQSGVRALWIQGWQVAAYWQAVQQAKAASVEVWLRGESNDLAPVPHWKRPIKQLLLGQLFNHVDRFLYIGSANKRLYQKFGVPNDHLYAAPYAVDNKFFVKQAAALRIKRDELRRMWKISDDSFCVLFCGKFISKKRPMDLVRAARLLAEQGVKIHVLFAGSGELGERLRQSCNVVYDAEIFDFVAAISGGSPHPTASFAGFLNQTEISRAYVAADCLVLPSDTGETWGLVVNEALASGLQCIASDSCGCTEDLLSFTQEKRSYSVGDIHRLSEVLVSAQNIKYVPENAVGVLKEHDFSVTIDTIHRLYRLIGEQGGVPVDLTCPQRQDD